ncbi:hypothetical protein [Roseibacillus persicicus]|uniref:hypothetical protein n=1 Tax=Roseibacillus persicicus TaxID=454148 RepID=UPI00280FA279|nr:hypothetical protein [Roseibacillus persicicus]MDQ8191389.1 hypothetical protein [Roseibacillus persicicus]
MEVVDAGFVLIPSEKIILLSLEVELSSPPAGARFLRFSFPSGESKEFSEFKVIPLGAGDSYEVRSGALKGMSFHESYPVKVELLADRSQSRVLDSLTQYVRFEVPPQALERMGVEL